MATISRARALSDPRSGGKIVRKRRIATAKTPYDRPAPVPKSPNWLTGLVFPATRMIASGAGKLLSSVFSPDTGSSSSSSSSSDSDSEDDVDDDNDHDISSDGVDGSNKKDGIPSEMIKCFRKEPQLTIGKSETKRVIEQLLMQETFSREECDRLIKIINSRVVDCSTIKEGQDGRLSEIPSRAVGSDTPDLCSKAVMEAKKWLEEKKVGSNSMSDLDHGTCGFNSVVRQHVTEGEVGSPVDMAKSYMRARPPWASPSITHIELGTPSPMATELLKEGTPYSVGDISFPSSKKRDFLATGSWNIQEEIRRVRSKATEDMLCTLPSTKIDLLSFAVEPKTTRSSLLADKAVAGIGDKMNESNSLTATKPMDESANLSMLVGTSHGIPVLEMTQDGSGNEALSSNPAFFVSEQNQVLDVTQIVEGGGADWRSHNSTSLELASQQHTDPRSSEINFSLAKEVTESRGTENANGFPSSQSSLSAGVDTEQNPRQSDEANPNPVGSFPDKLTNSIPVEETCELLSEASVEVPVVNETTVVNETDSIASGSQNSSSMRYEELSQELTKQNSKRSLAGKARSMVEKQQGKKLGRYSRKGRGRGK